MVKLLNIKSIIMKRMILLLVCVAGTLGMTSVWGETATKTEGFDRPFWVTQKQPPL